MKKIKIADVLHLTCMTNSMGGIVMKIITTGEEYLAADIYFVNEVIVFQEQNYEGLNVQA